MSCGDGSIGVWSLATGDRLADLHGGQELLEDPIAFGLGGLVLAAVNKDGGITEWNV